jgi:hypothetical protein
VAVRETRALAVPTTPPPPLRREGVWEVERLPQVVGERLLEGEAEAQGEGRPLPLPALVRLALGEVLGQGVEVEEVLVLLLPPRPPPPPPLLREPRLLRDLLGQAVLVALTLRVREKRGEALSVAWPLALAQGELVPVLALTMLGVALGQEEAETEGERLSETLGEAEVEVVREGTRLALPPPPLLPLAAAVTLGEPEAARETLPLPLTRGLLDTVSLLLSHTLMVLRPEGMRLLPGVTLPEKLALALGLREALGEGVGSGEEETLGEGVVLLQGEGEGLAEALLVAVAQGEVEAVGRARLGVRVALTLLVAPPLPRAPSGVAQEVAVAVGVREAAPPRLALGEGEALMLSLGDCVTLALALEEVVTEALLCP